MMQRDTWTLITLLALGAGCPGGGGTSTGTSGTGEVTESSGGPGTSGSSGTSSSGTSSGEPTTGEPTTGELTTGEPTGTSASSTGGEAYCGFDEGAMSPFLELTVLGGGALTDGATWPLECGGQGLWMFGLYPLVGGWDPMATNITFTLSVDVEGYNINPEGHFFSGQDGYYIGCEILDGGVTGVVPVLPPDGIADLSVLDGLPATVHVELDGGGTPLTVDAAVTLSAPKELVDLGCEPGF